MLKRERLTISVGLHEGCYEATNAFKNRGLSLSDLLMKHINDNFSPYAAYNNDEFCPAHSRAVERR